ncbi:MAG: ribonuclease III [Chloroherpetonaceae bacterium]|nr:ribonuclease III [Chloroherpetonaceae bacterium]
MRAIKSFAYWLKERAPIFFGLPSPSKTELIAPLQYPSVSLLDINLHELKRSASYLSGYPIRDVSLFALALTHRSVLDSLRDERILSNERLEFLGDAVLDLAVGEYLFHNYAQFDEGKLTKLRSQVVNAKTLSIFARKLELGKLLIVSDSAESIGVRDSETTLSDAFEALIGAIYLDGGYERANQFLHHHLLSQLDFAALIDTDENYKSALLEYAQAQRLPYPTYLVLNEDGPSHKKIFTVGVRLGDDYLGYGSGKNKKTAEQLAAKEALDKIKTKKLEKSLRANAFAAEKTNIELNSGRMG